MIKNVHTLIKEPFSHVTGPLLTATGIPDMLSITFSWSLYSNVRTVSSWNYQYIATFPDNLFMRGWTENSEYILNMSSMQVIEVPPPRLGIDIF